MSPHRARPPAHCAADAEPTCKACAFSVSATTPRTTRADDSSFLDAIALARAGRRSTTAATTAATPSSRRTAYYSVGNANNGGASTFGLPNSTNPNVTETTGLEVVNPINASSSDAGVPASNSAEVDLLIQYEFVDGGLVADGGTVDKAGKDNNYRGVTQYNGALYFTKGSGSNGIQTVYTVPSLPTVANAASQTIGIVPTDSAKVTGGNYTPFAVFFANATTTYVTDEGSGNATDVASHTGLQKWSLVGSTWQLDYVLTAGLIGTGRVRALSVGTHGGEGPVVAFRPRPSSTFARRETPNNINVLRHYRRLDQLGPFPSRTRLALAGAPRIARCEQNVWRTYCGRWIHDMNARSGTVWLRYSVARAASARPTPGATSRKGSADGSRPFWREGQIGVHTRAFIRAGDPSQHANDKRLGTKRGGERCVIMRDFKCATQSGFRTSGKPSF